MPRKPAKVQPIERFPIKPRKDGRFQKRIKGRLYYFGDGSGDRQSALSEYDRVKYALYEGRTSQPPVDAVGLKWLMNHFLRDRDGVISDDCLRQYKRALRRFVKYFGAERAWNDLTPDDFTAYAAHLRKHARSGYTFNRERAAILAMFNHADEQDWVERVPKFGKGFRRVPKSKLRETKTPRLLSQNEINALLGYAVGPLFAMILLGLNGGFGISDCTHLPWSAVDLDQRVIRFARVKNNIPRTVPLWSETVWALKRIQGRDGLVFKSKRAKRWHLTSVAHAFARIAERAEVELPDGVGFYCLRHTYATYANEVRDTDARRHIMGRLLPNLDDVYVEGLFLPRLIAVTDHVRSRLGIGEIIGAVV